MLFNLLEHYLVVAEGGGDYDDEDYDDEDEDSWNRDNEGEDELGWDPNELLPLKSIDTTLSSLPERTIGHMRAKMDANRHTDDYEIALLHALTYEDNSSQIIEYMTCLYNEISDFYPDRFSISDPDVNTYTLVRDYMQGLRNYESVGYKLPEDIFSVTPKERKLMDALHYLNGTLGDNEENVEPELGKLVMERPDDVEDVINIVLERDTRDANVIREILNSRTPSIRSGIL